MLLAVAGLPKEDIDKRTKKLAEGNWTAFPPAERLAFQFAHKQASAPWTLTHKDIDGLKKTIGATRTLDLIWYGAWCNYMTRVADALQLPLERDNVFGGPRTKKKPKKDG